VGYDLKEFHDALVKHGLIVPVGVPGAFGRGALFEEVLERFNALVSELSRSDGAQLYTFPPVISRKVLERVKFLESFPHLCGSVYSFFGDEAEAKSLAAAAGAGKPWAAFLGMTDVVMNPAACYPVYPSFTGTLPEGGRLVTMLNWVYRHEPSNEPTRMQSFRVREFVRAGSAAQVLEWREMWLQRGLTLLNSLGLPVKSEVAADPFFGRGGKLLAVNQKEQQLKFEIVVPVISPTEPTAVCSFNYHQQHFSSAFDIRTADGSPASTACLGFGLERLVMALFKTHGFDPASWPPEVRRRLWP
jgi:seryl-tRNA synthetase